MDTVRLHTKVQYKSGTIVADDTTKYKVVSSIDLYWLTKDEKLKSSYLTVLKAFGSVVATK